MKYSESFPPGYLHGDPQRDERKIVLDAEMVEGESLVAVTTMQR